MFKKQFQKLFKEFLKRKNFLSVSENYFLLFFILKNKFLNKQTVIFSLFLFAINQKSFRSIQNNVCFFSGSKRSVVTFFNLHRLEFDNQTKLLNLPFLFLHY